MNEKIIHLAEKEKVYSQQLNIKTFLYLQNEAMYKERKKEEKREEKKINK